MPKCSKCCRCSKYMWLIGFQIMLIILFFAFVKHDTNQIKAALSIGSILSSMDPTDPNYIAKVLMAVVNSTAQQSSDVVNGYEGTHLMIYVGFGFLTTFLMKYCYSALGISMLVAALVAQWSIFTRGVFYMTRNMILLNKKLLIRADFMSAAVLITFGAICGQANVNQLLFIGIFEAAVGSANLYLLESVIKISDVGGSIGIHAFGAFFGMLVSSAWNSKGSGCRKSEAYELHPKEIPSYMSDIMSMMGTLFLFVYWPNFNSAQATPDEDVNMAIANTYIAIAACTVTTFALSSVLHDGKFGMEHIQNSTLAGGVAVGAVANLHLQPYGAIIIGILAGVMSVYGISKLKNLICVTIIIFYSYQILYPLVYRNNFTYFIQIVVITSSYFGRYCAAPDTRNVMFLHGFPGAFSGIVSVFLALGAKKIVYGDHLYRVFPAMKTGRTASEQAIYQLLGTAVSITIASFAGAVCGCITKLKCFKPLKKEEQFDDIQYWELPK